MLLRCLTDIHGNKVEAFTMYLNEMYVVLIFIHSVYGRKNHYYFIFRSHPGLPR